MLNDTPESGDKHERLPGSFSDASSSSDDEDDAFDVNIAWEDLQQLSISSLSEPLEVRCQSSLNWCSSDRVPQAVREWIYSLNNFFPSPVDDFAERFKYDLISSRLLSISVAPSPIHTHAHARSLTPPPDQPLPGELEAPHQDSQKIENELRTISGGLVCFGLAALWKEHRASAILALLLSLVFAKTPSTPKTKYAYIPQTLECLEGLKTAVNAWDNSVNDAIAIIEKEERKYVSATSIAGVVN